MTNDEFLKRHFVPIPTAALQHDEYGRTLIAKCWLQDAARECADYRREDRRLDQGGPFPDDEDREVPPCEWEFDQERKRVMIGKYTMPIRGDIQFKFLRFVCSGGTDAQQAWKEVWNYSTTLEYQTIRNVISALNAKLEAADLGWRVVATTRIVGIKNLENLGNEGV